MEEIMAKEFTSMNQTKITAESIGYFNLPGPCREDSKSDSYHVDKLLNGLVAEYVDMGCLDASKSLGIHPMPDGYALMLNGDRTHFFWLCYDGQESAIHWSKWVIYHWANSRCAESI